jgi:hypothetical protein
MVETILEFLDFSGVDFQSAEKIQQDMSALLVQGVFVHRVSGVTFRFKLGKYQGPCVCLAPQDELDSC